MDNFEERKKIIYTLPRNVTREISKLCESRGRSLADISEIRLRVRGRSCFKIGDERIELCADCSREEMDRSLAALSGGALYAHRETLKEGYISCEGGVRVGVAGEARYDGGGLVGISGVSSLVIRLPVKVEADMSELFSAWDGTRRGMLIYSPPGVGKTTALRALAGYISGTLKSQLAIVDTRREFALPDCEYPHADILSGYKRGKGMEIALRTLSPDVIMADEIGCADEASLMLESLNSGVRLAASAHAGSFGELKKRKNTAELLEHGVFDTLVGISLEDGRRVMKFGGDSD